MSRIALRRLWAGRVVVFMLFSSIRLRNRLGTLGRLRRIWGFGRGRSRYVHSFSPRVTRRFTVVVVFQLALNNLYEYTLARPPSRTLIDPLSTFILTLSLSPSPTSLHDAFVSAKEAALATIDLEAKVGRAAYVDAESLREAKVPDAGAWGVWCILEAVQKKLEGN